MYAVYGLKKAKYYEGSYYYGIKRICQDASLEIAEMQKEVISYTYKERILPKLEWVFSILYKQSGKFMYVFIIDKKKEQESVCEPNYLLENFFVKLKKSLGEESEVFGNVKSLFEVKGYDYFFG